jgi:hypothetical protein
MKYRFSFPAALGLVLLGGCGNPGPPQPPSLMLAAPVHDLSAQRIADTVNLSWTTSERTTDQVLLHKNQEVSLCRAVVGGPCLTVTALTAVPGKPAHFEDPLPAALTAGAPQLLRYEVRLKNRSGRDAGESNPAYAAAGAAPPAVIHVSATTTPKGILVRWKTKPPIAPAPMPPSGATLRVSLMRVRVLRRGESAKPNRAATDAGVPQPLQQILETAETAGQNGWAPQRTLDSDALLNRTYTYTVQLVQQERLDGHLLSLRGAPAESAPLDAQDIFPPSTPQGLDAAANPQGGAIDLSWEPDARPDNSPGTTAYFVYRRIEGGAAPPVRVSGKQPIAAPAWSDASVTTGVRYAYSVSAVDESGRESGRCAEVVVELPAGDR